MDWERNLGEDLRELRARTPSFFLLKLKALRSEASLEIQDLPLGAKPPEGSTEGLRRSVAGARLETQAPFGGLESVRPGR